MPQTPHPFPPLKFRPVPVPRLWGGHRLKDWFAVTTDEPIGEYWVLSGHPHGMSVVSSGPHAGKTLAELAAEHPDAYLGASPQPRFPLLIKFIEAAQDLSVQVHPDDAYARRHEGDFGKTEAWYVLDCPPDGRVVYGHRFSSAAEYRRAIEERRIPQYLNHRAIAPGDVVFVPAGTLHALLAGTVVLEVQQTSDVTYRVYDWDRVDANGKPRDLHVDRAADVLRFSGGEGDDRILAENRLNPASPPWKRLVSCPYFTMDHARLEEPSMEVAPGRPGNPDILIGLGGRGRLGWSGGEMSVQRGDALLIPANVASYWLMNDDRLEVLRVHY
ncbi:type I phosphomannose isomerase catalytic subunit [Alicyclobacillus sp.]|uniref:type I phosphomannose isomerase catalytic subunit n=1 Tax=Alicyclobacillus sp. TaxID=61169 RepID=UPI0025B94A8A|nr:type I phosphomannose isomerase catalytic subunit [Alicyclobacillus sp.]MCL6516063.1 class I mannose-6-phosphate isomerase [Alicyclobacillus sp.]